MKKGIILCSGGYSSSIIANRMNELGKGIFIFEEGGYGFDQSVEDFANKYDIIILAPHLSMYFDEIEDDLEDKATKVIQIQSSEYVAQNVHKLYERILKLMEL